jgi:secondary thiamine-phosphate synthase enzyme
MISYQISLKSKERIEIIDITDEINKLVRQSKVESGFAILFAEHVTACITINENDDDVKEDIKEVLLKLVPIKGNYKHKIENNAYAHIISTMIKPSLIVPIEKNKLKLGRWQSIFFFELDGPRERKIDIQIWGE